MGTGAGYGVPLRLDREYVARELGFAGILESAVYAQLSRGKLEASLIHGLWQVMLDLGRLASDLVLFGMEGLGLVVLDDGVCTGSSMIPQKRNPDVLELIRGNCAVVSSLEERVRGICSGLVSGYHRDLQLTKRPLMEAFSLTRGSLRAMEKVVCTMHIDEERCRAAMTEELYAFDRVCGLVAGGMPFRDAYLAVKDGLD